MVDAAGSVSLSGSVRITARVAVAARRGAHGLAVFVHRRAATGTRWRTRGLRRVAKNSDIEADAQTVRCHPRHHRKLEHLGDSLADGARIGAPHMSLRT